VRNSNYSTALVKIFAFIAVMFLMPLVTRADIGGTVSFLDGTANPAFTDTTGRTTGSCVGDSCTVNIRAPKGYTWSGALLVDVWLMPSTSNVRDVLCGDIYGFSGHCSFTSNMVTLQFVAEGLAPLGAFSSGMQLQNGILQEAGNIFWMNSAKQQVTDSLKVEAGLDLAAAPEPSSLAVLAGLFTAGLVMTRRRRNNKPV
jgi:hypothetical protein